MLRVIILFIFVQVEACLESKSKVNVNTYWIVMPSCTYLSVGPLKNAEGLLIKYLVGLPYVVIIGLL